MNLNTNDRLRSQAGASTSEIVPERRLRDKTELSIRQTQQTRSCS